MLLNVIADKTAQVNSEDYGRDLSSVQILITKEVSNSNKHCRWYCIIFCYL